MAPETLCVAHPSEPISLEPSGSCGEADHLLPLPVSLLDCEMIRLLEESEDFGVRDEGRHVGPCLFI